MECINDLTSQKGTPPILQAISDRYFRFQYMANILLRSDPIGPMTNHMTHWQGQELNMQLIAR